MCYGIAKTIAAPIRLLMLEIVGLAAFPLCWLLLPGLADRGYAVARILGLALVAYLAWLLASIGAGTFGRSLVFACLLLLTAVSAVIVRRRWRAIRADLRAIWPQVVAVEIVFLVFLAIML